MHLNPDLILNVRNDLCPVVFYQRFAGVFLFIEWSSCSGLPWFCVLWLFCFVLQLARGVMPYRADECEGVLRIARSVVMSCCGLCVDTSGRYCARHLLSPRKLHPVFHLKGGICVQKKTRSFRVFPPEN